MLETYLKPLSDVSSEIKDWNIGGQLYLDYFTLLDSSQKLKDSSELTDYELESIHAQCVPVADRLTQLTCANVTDRMSQSVMVKSVAKVMTSLMNRSETASHFRQQITSRICLLSMPEDQTMETLASISHSLVRAVRS